ncbi:cathepsin L-like proteinase [Diabrotica virgifera virgifera]|uniref:Cathepsin L-like proteinase isoform X1 n=1 Tax=Diabrotica virgifera virgifera TaxID=50390 RepID=A0A6P7G4J7_DIAVI|nr:cathepsin L-like proteinase [Diabrotica virgifera virgifera]
MFKYFLLFLIAAALAADTYLSDDEEFEKFKKDFSRNYETPNEEQHRRGIFVNTLNTVKAHNAKFERGEVSYSLGINQFADLTQDEFENRYTMKKWVEQQGKGKLATKTATQN